MTFWVKSIISTLLICSSGGVVAGSYFLRESYLNTQNNQKGSSNLSEGKNDESKSSETDTKGKESKENQHVEQAKPSETNNLPSNQTSTTLEPTLNGERSESHKD